MALRKGIGVGPASGDGDPQAPTIIKSAIANDATTQDLIRIDHLFPLIEAAGQLSFDILPA